MPFRRIVVGVDFSVASLNAVRWVASKLAPGAKIFVVHVISEPRIPEFLRPLLPPNASDADAAVYPGLRALANLAGGDAADVVVARGNPASELARIASEVDADLVCVGRSRRRRGSGRFGATTPQRLLAWTTIPVLILPESARVTPGAVLAAVSDGEDSAEVLRAAVGLADAWGERLDVLHSLEPDVVAFARDAGPVDDARLCGLAQDWIAERVVEERAGSTAVQAIARIGDAGEEVIAHAGRNAIGLIVAGRRVRSESSPATSSGRGVGSTTRLISWAAACPLLIVGCPPASEPQRPRVVADWRRRGRPQPVARASVFVTARPEFPRRGRGVAPNGVPPDGGDAA